MNISRMFGMILLAGCIALPLEAVERKPPVMITFVDGSEQRFRLEQVNDDSVIVLKAGSQRKTVYSRSEVSSMRFRPEVPKRIPAGEEAVILADGTVLQGSPVWMDGSDFWIEVADQKRKRIQHKQLSLIQFANSKDAIRISTASPDAVSSRVNVAANNGWTSSNLPVTKGEQIWFTIGDYSFCSCDSGSQKVLPDGNQNTFNEKAIIPSANICSLIGKIGEKGIPFAIGMRKTAIVAETSGRLYLGVNDVDFKDNTGAFDVFVKVSRSSETSEIPSVSNSENNNAN